MSTSFDVQPNARIYEVPHMNIPVLRNPIFGARGMDVG